MNSLKLLKHISFSYLFIVLLSCGPFGGLEDKKESPLKFEQTPLIRTLGEEDVKSQLAMDAPSLITRKISKRSSGELLIATFDEVLTWNTKFFERLPSALGMPSLDAFDALEDSEGNIWIASTHNGVFKYDGSEFMQFTEKDGLSHNRTMDLFEDKAGNIWIATMGGASCYDGNSFRNYTVKDGLTHDDITVILEDKLGRIWFGTRGEACFLDPVTSIFTIISSNGTDSLTNIRSIIEDREGVIWLTGECGTFCYRGLAPMPLIPLFGNALYEDRDGNIWVSQDSTLGYFEKRELERRRFRYQTVFLGNEMLFGISEDRNGDIWVGTLTGVLKYEIDKHGIHKYTENSHN